MEAETVIGRTDSQLEISSAELDSIMEPSKDYVGSWHNLISQTNWEKGRIILEWRSQLETEGVDSKLYADPAWSRLVGEVTPQHVGRLRRTYVRFGESYADYQGLYWSHFFAALDWDDAEMWLEGAVQNKWSVSKMRYQRWETLGKLKEDKPEASDILANPGEEGVNMIAPAGSGGETVYENDRPGIQGPLREGPDFGDEDSSSSSLSENGTSSTATSAESNGNKVDIESILEDVPDNIADPFRELRTAVSDARDDEWASVKRIHLIALVNELKMLLRIIPKEKIETNQEV